MLEIHGEHVANMTLKGDCVAGVVMEGRRSDGADCRHFFRFNSAAGVKIAFAQAKEFADSKEIAPFDWHIVID